MYKQARRVLATVTAILLLFSGNVVARAEEQTPVGIPARDKESAWFLYT